MFQNMPFYFAIATNALPSQFGMQQHALSIKQHMLCLPHYLSSSLPVCVQFPSFLLVPEYKLGKDIVLKSLWKSYIKKEKIHDLCSLPYILWAFHL